MMCRYDRESDQYLTDDGMPCKVDDYGDPTRHCTSRRTCGGHVGQDELTCALCLGRVRKAIRKIRDFSALLPTVAEVEEWGSRTVQGVNSEAAYLAGPAADVEAWSWRKIAAKAGTAWHLSLVEEDDDWHPYTVLTRWEFMIREDYRQPRTDPTSIVSAADYLDRNLGKIAQDDTQDFARLRTEITTCWNRMQQVLAIKRWMERGAPCPTCVATGAVDPAKVKLQRVYSHWCTDPECTQPTHSLTDDLDVWVCPRNREHWWNPQGYADLMNERKGA